MSLVSSGICDGNVGMTGGESCHSEAATVLPVPVRPLVGRQFALPKRVGHREQCESFTMGPSPRFNGTPSHRRPKAVTDQ